VFLSTPKHLQSDYILHGTNFMLLQSNRYVRKDSALSVTNSRVPTLMDFWSCGPPLKEPWTAIA